MKTFRLIGNIVVAVVLVVILIGLVFIIIDEKASKNVSESVRERSAQAVPFGGGRK